MIADRYSYMNHLSMCRTIFLSVDRQTESGRLHCLFAKPANTCSMALARRTETRTASGKVQLRWHKGLAIAEERSHMDDLATSGTSAARMTIACMRARRP